MLSRASVPNRDSWAVVIVLLTAATALVPSAVSVVVAPDRLGGEGTERAVRAALVLTLVVLLAGRLVSHLRTGRLPSLRNGSIVAALLAYWLVGMASILWNDRALPQLSGLAIPVVIVGLAAFGGSQRLVLRLLEYCLLGTCYASLLLAVVYPSAAFPTGPTFEETRLLGFVVDHRLAGITSHPNVLAVLAATAVILVVARRGRAWPMHLAVTLCVLVLAESRAITAALVLAIATLVALSKCEDRRAQSRILIGVTAFAWAAVIALPLLASAGLLAFSLNGRTSLWDEALSRVEEHPLLGFGPGAWTEVVEVSQVWVSWHGHNQFVETLTTVGVIGVISLAVVAALWLVQLARDPDGWTALAATSVLFWAVAIFESPVWLWGINTWSWLLVMLTVGCLGAGAELSTRWLIPNQWSKAVK